MLSCNQRPLGFTAFALVLCGSGAALRHSALGSKVRRDKALTAMCVAGNARTFPDPTVIKSLKDLWQWLEVRGNRSQDRPDLFTFLTVQSDKDKYHPERLTLQSTRRAVVGAVKQLGPVDFRVVESPNEVTEANVDQYVRPNRSCFDIGWWASDPSFFPRFVNQLLHIQRCLQMVTRMERKMQQHYEVVFVARPDLKYTLPPLDISAPELISRAKAGFIPHETDFFMALNHSGVMRLLDRDRAMPLTCHPADKTCCHKADRPENMFGILLKSDFHWRTSFHLGTRMGRFTDRALQVLFEAYPGILELDERPEDWDAKRSF